MTYDPDVLERLAAHAGQTVHLRSTELVEDVDGMPAGIEVVDEGSGVLVMPDPSVWAHWGDRPGDG